MKDKVKFAVMAESEVTSDIPEHASLNVHYPGTDWDAMRGLGATMNRPVVTTGEENILCKGWPADVYRGEMIMVHEFAHVWSGTDLDTNPSGSWHAPTRQPGDGDLWTNMNDVFKNQVTDKGLWPNCYAGHNAREYWAEGVQAFFDCDQVGPVGGDGIHNDVNSRDELSSEPTHERLAPLSRYVSNTRFQLTTRSFTISSTRRSTRQAVGARRAAATTLTARTTRWTSLALRAPSTRSSPRTTIARWNRNCLKSRVPETFCMALTTASLRRARARARITTNFVSVRARRPSAQRI